MTLTKRVLLFAGVIAFVAGCSSGTSDGGGNSGSSGKSPVIIGDGSGSGLPGDTLDIRWSADETTSETVNVETSFDGGETWVPAGEGTENDGVFEWAVPELPGASALIRVVDPDGNIVAEPRPVEIAGTLPTITVDGGVTVVNAEEQITLTWPTSNSQPLKFTLLVSLDGGEFTEYISDVSNAGTYSFDVPEAEQIQFQIRDDYRNLVFAESALMTVLQEETPPGYPGLSLSAGGSSSSSSFRVHATIGDPVSGKESTSSSFKLRGNLTGVVQ